MSDLELKLNKYQRDNLLWLLTLVMEGDIPWANTGDWVGEIRWMLDPTTGTKPDMSPNLSLEEFRKFNKVDDDE